MLLTQISITFMSGPRDGDTLTFPLDPTTSDISIVLTIGRREDTDVCLHYDSQASRLHAHLSYDGEQFWIEDTGSRNGTFLSTNERIPDNEKVVLEPGALFRVGKTWLRLDPLPSDVTAPAETIEPLTDAAEDEDDSSAIEDDDNED